jgi:DNA-binding response OmpR family regulator
MENQFTILIADRNPHVREFLRRELEAEGYRVRLAKDGRKVTIMVQLEDPPDLVILDPEIPYLDEVTSLDQVREKDSYPPFIIHTFHADFMSHPSIKGLGEFVEKRGDIDLLKAKVSEVLRKTYPERLQWQDRAC